LQALTLDAIRPIRPIRPIRIEIGSAPSGRIAVWTTGEDEALSVVFDARSRDRAEAPRCCSPVDRSIAAGPLTPVLRY
jgi:hypothetical protein